jgi:transposase
MLRELMHAHRKLLNDYVRAENRLKSLFRSRGIAVKSVEHSSVKQLPARMHLAAKSLMDARDFAAELRAEAEANLLKEARRHPVVRMLTTCPGMGPIRTAQFVSVVIDPRRFRTKRQLWAYSGLAVTTRISDEWTRHNGQWRRDKRPLTRGLNQNHNSILKNVFKGAATTVTARLQQDPLFDHYQRLLEAGTKPNLAKLTIARRIAAISLAMWKNEEAYDPEKTRSQS